MCTLPVVFPEIDSESVIHWMVRSELAAEPEKREKLVRVLGRVVVGDAFNQNDEMGWSIH